MVIAQSISRANTEYFSNQTHTIMVIAQKIFNVLNPKFS